MNRYEYLARLREPSTWAGIAALLSVFGLDLAPADGQAIVQGGVGLAGLLAVIMSEKGH